MIAFVRGVIAASMSVGSMFRSSAFTSTKTGVAPQWTTTFAVAGHVMGVVITSSPGPIVGGEQRQVERRRAGSERHRMLRADVLGEAPLELSGAGTGRDPAGLERLDDRLDFLRPDGRRLEAEQRLAASSRSGRLHSGKAYRRRPR